MNAINVFLIPFLNKCFLNVNHFIKLNNKLIKMKQFNYIYKKFKIWFLSQPIQLYIYNIIFKTE